MELNKRAEMDDVPLLAIGRQSYDIASPSDTELQSGASAWSPVDCNGAGPSNLNDIWNADWRPYSCDVPHSHSLHAQHRAKRQQCWGTASLISEQQGTGPSSLFEDESMKSSHAELFGCCETANTGNLGFDFFHPTPSSASISRMNSSPHSSMLVTNSSQASGASGTGHWKASASQGTDLGSFFAESDCDNNKDLLLSESAKNTIGKGVDQFMSTAGGNCIELNGCQEASYFRNILVPQRSHSQREHEKEKSGGPIDCMQPNEKIQGVHGDFRSAYKRKISRVDLAESSAFETQFMPLNESAAPRSGVYGTSSGQIGFSNFHPISSTSVTTPWGDLCNESNSEYACHNDTNFSKELIGRTPGLFGSGEDSARSITNQPLSLPSDTQSHSPLLYARSRRRSGHSHPFSQKNLISGSGNTAGYTSLLQSSDHWPALGSEISPAPPFPVSNWSPSGSRRNSSAFSFPGSRDRSSAQGAFEGSRSRSMQGRALDWAMAAAPSPAAPEHRSVSHLFPSAGVVVPTGREIDLTDSSAQITQAATSLFNSVALASYFPASESDMFRVSSNPPPVSTVLSHQISVNSSTEAHAAVPGQPAGRSALSPSPRGQRDAVFSAPIQSLLGLPFRGMHTLRADGDYRRQFLSEILNFMHHAFRSEDLNIEELVMLDPSAVYGDAHDQHRDMRLDVDNMTYEELLALEERIGNVNTGVDKEKISLCLRESKFSSLDATVAAISQDSDVKCCICQEEFVEEDELGRLDCSHGYHSACIRQWLLQKNECPICKAPAYVKP